MMLRILLLMDYIHIEEKKMKVKNYTPYTRLSGLRDYANKDILNDAQWPQDKSLMLDNIIGFIAFCLAIVALFFVLQLTPCETDYECEVSQFTKYEN